MLGVILFITIPILIMIIIGIVSIKNGLKNGFSKSIGDSDDMFEHGINPANGLPTVNGVDTQGNLSGSDFNQW